MHRVPTRHATVLLTCVFLGFLVYRNFMLFSWLQDDFGFFPLAASHPLQGLTIGEYLSQETAMNYGGLFWYMLRYLAYLFGPDPVLQVRIVNSLAFAGAFLVFLRACDREEDRVKTMVLVLTMPAAHFFVKMSGPESLQILFSALAVYFVVFTPWLWLGALCCGVATGLKPNALALFVSLSCYLFVYAPLARGFLPWLAKYLWNVLTLTTLTVVGYLAATPATLAGLLNGAPLGTLFTSIARGQSTYSLETLRHASRADWLFLWKYLQDTTSTFPYWGRDFSYYGGIFHFSISVFTWCCWLYVTWRLKDRRLFILMGSLFAGSATLIAAIIFRPRNEISYFAFYWFPLVPLLIAVFVVAANKAKSSGIKFILSASLVANLVANYWFIDFSLKGQYEFYTVGKRKEEIIQCVKDKVGAVPTFVWDYAYQFPLIGQYAGANCQGFPNFICTIPEGDPAVSQMLLIGEMVVALYQRFEQKVPGMERFKELDRCGPVLVYANLAFMEAKKSALAVPR